MNATVPIELNVPEAVYDQLRQQPAEIRSAAIEAAIEAISDFLEQEAKLAEGREMLQRLPAEAKQFEDNPPRDLASKHDDYLYGK